MAKMKKMMAMLIALALILGQMPMLTTAAEEPGTTKVEINLDTTLPQGGSGTPEDPSVIIIPGEPVTNTDGTITITTEAEKTWTDSSVGANGESITTEYQQSTSQTTITDGENNNLGGSATVSGSQTTTTVTEEEKQISSGTTQGTTTEAEGVDVSVTLTPGSTNSQSVGGTVSPLNLPAAGTTKKDNATITTKHTTNADGSVTAVTTTVVTDENGNVLSETVLTQTGKYDSNGKLIEVSSNEKKTEYETTTGAPVVNGDTTTTVTTETATTTETDLTETATDRKVTASMTEVEGTISTTTGGNDMTPIENAGSYYEDGTKKDEVYFGDTVATKGKGEAPDGYDLFYSANGEATEHSVKYGNSSTSAMQFELTDTSSPDGDTYTAYCVDLNTYTQDGWWYTVDNLENAGYYTEEEAKHIRAIVLNGYWGTEQGESGSLDTLKDTLKTAIQNGELTGMTEADVDALTEGDALTATQMAIWKYGDSSSTEKNLSAVVQPDGRDRNAQKEAEAQEDRINNVAAYLAGLTEEPGETSTIINENQFIDTLNLIIGNKADHANNNDDNAENDAYNASMTFTLVVDTNSVEGDMVVTVVSDGVTLATANLKSTDENASVLTPNADGSYTLEGLTLVEGQNIDFTVNLAGTQELEKGVYIYTSQVKTANESEINKEIKELQDIQDAVNNGTGGSNKHFKRKVERLNQVLSQYGSLEAYKEYLVKKNSQSSQTFVGIAEGKKAVNTEMTVSLDFEVEEGSVTTGGSSYNTSEKTTTTEVSVKKWDHEYTFEPEPTEPKPTEPKPTEPKPTEPKPTEPKPTEPKPTEPQPTEPQPTQPQPTEPQPTETEETVETPVNPDPAPFFWPRVTNDEVEIPDEEVPLAAAPKTGDISLILGCMSMLSAGGLAVLNKKRKEEE